jgi:hypothetical protein
VSLFFNFAKSIMLFWNNASVKTCLFNLLLELFFLNKKREIKNRKTKVPLCSNKPYPLIHILSICSRLTQQAALGELAEAARWARGRGGALAPRSALSSWPGLSSRRRWAPRRGGQSRRAAWVIGPRRGGESRAARVPELPNRGDFVGGVQLFFDLRSEMGLHVYA